MFRTVAVPLDGSALSARALPWWSECWRSTRNAYFQVPSDPVAEQQAQEYLEGVAAELRSSVTGSVAARVEHGDAATTIARIARETRADAIAMATH